MINVTEVRVADSVEYARRYPSCFFGKAGVEPPGHRAENERRSKAESGVHRYQLGAQVDLPIEKKLRSPKANEQQAIENKPNCNNATVRDRESTG